MNKKRCLQLWEEHREGLMAQHNAYLNQSRSFTVEELAADENLREFNKELMERTSYLSTLISCADYQIKDLKKDIEREKKKKEKEKSQLLAAFDEEEA